ncbi:hypothetical protein CCAX7_56700 [Capsulimonas corticalis]|uniref:Uncharacterized protein n=1 Tax=Capsulimonas corticalis TaxID=2219043 RepID=A0A402D0F4_9BACT|nr:hypothetical protein [Capsulimonas corticalis]BDI33619.1 hypothetical protein CCAX7_56700 [Capsulimonas corticalis]
MPVDISLHTQDHGRLDTVVYPREATRDLIPYGDDAYPLLSAMDPGDYTFFAQAQMPEFLAEWRRLLSAAETPDDKEFLTRVEKLAERCAAEPGCYLKFDGD